MRSGWRSDDDPQRVARRFPTTSTSYPRDRSSGADRALNRHLVVDEQNPGGSSHASCSTAIARVSAGTTIVNRAPPSGQFSAADASVFGREQAAGDRQPHAGARTRAIAARPRRGRSARRCAAGPAPAMPGPRSRTRQRQPVGRRRRPATLHRAARRRVLRGVFEQVRERARRQPRIDAHQTSDSTSAETVDGGPSSACSTWSRAASTISDGCTQRRSAPIAPASMRAISRMFWNRRVRRSTSVSDQRRSARAAPRRSATTPGDCVAATRMAVSGVRRSWPSDASSADFSSSLCRASSAALRSSRNCAALDRNRGDAAERVERPGFDGRPATAEQADRLRAEAQRHQLGPPCAAGVDRPRAASVDPAHRRAASSRRDRASASAIPPRTRATRSPCGRQIAT